MHNTGAVKYELHLYLLATGVTLLFNGIVCFVIDSHGTDSSDNDFSSPKPLTQCL